MSEPTAHRSLSALALVIVAAARQSTGSPSTMPPGPVPSIGASPSVGANLARPSATSGPLDAARNGVIVYSDAAGDIHSLDPATGKANLLIGGPTNDLAPAFRPGRNEVRPG